MAAFPLQLGTFDHYTLIVEDAATVAAFHEKVLGFKPARVQLVNAGTAPRGGHDMLNHVLWLPGSTERVVVITEGLTDDSIFSRYLREFGAGVHHVAFSVDDIESALQCLRDGGIETTSQEILRDPITGLRQIFVSREHCGYFMELIERSEQTSAGVFVEDNMAALANTMQRYLPPEPATSRDDPQVRIAVPLSRVKAYLLDPTELPHWTGHRMIRAHKGGFVEARMHGDVSVEVTDHGDHIRYTWRLGSAEKTIRLQVAPTAQGSVVSVDLAHVPSDQRVGLQQIIGLELRVLAATLEEQRSRISESDWQRLTVYHLEIHQRTGL